MTGQPGGPDHPPEGAETVDLFDRARGGDQIAWDALVSRFTALLWRIARANHLSPADAADVVQTTWLRLVEHSDRIAEPERLGSWLATTARRECIRVLRRTNRERPHPDDHEAFEAIEDEARPDDRLLREERATLLWSAVATLPDRAQRLLQVLMADPPPSYDDIAAALGMPLGSIGPTRARSLARLRELLDEEDPDEP